MQQTFNYISWWQSYQALTRARTAGLVMSVIFPLCYGLLGVWAGKDASWDFMNYHWYNPYAFLTDRLGFDLAVGHHATYYNPLLDIPLYWAGTRWPASLVGFLLSFSQGLNFPLLFWLAWALFSQLTPGYRLLVSGATATSGMAGAGALMEIGAVFHDNLISLGVLAALLVIIVRHRVLMKGNSWAAGGWAGLAGIFAGITAGLKLTTAIYALGLGGALLFVPTSFPRRMTLAFSFGVGGIIGLAIGGGFWMHRLWEFSGSPFFPYFNNLFHSPLLSNASYKDENFIPHEALTRIFFPFFFSVNSFRVAEWYFRDVRILTAFVVLPGSALWFFFNKARRACLSTRTWMHPASGRFLAVAAAISYTAWLWMFCIYRYLLSLEMITPLLIAVALGWLPLSNKARIMALLTIIIFSQAMVEVSFAGRKPWGGQYVQVTVPNISADEKAMILMTGYEPMAYVIPYFPPSIPFVRIENWLSSPNDPPTGLSDLMHRRVQEHRGSRYVIFQPNEEESAPKVLAAYGLDFDASSCRPVTSNAFDPLKLCRVYESQQL